MLDSIAAFASAASGLSAVIVLLTSGALVVSRNWRVSLAVLAVQYVFAFLLTSTVLLPAVALVKLVTGWAACGILLATGIQGRRTDGTESGGGKAFGFLSFRTIAAVMVGVVAAEASGRLGFALPGLTFQSNSACYFLIALGLLHLGLTEDPLFVGAALLTLLSGFEIFYAAVEPSVAVLGLLSAVNIGVALVTAYVVSVGRSSKQSESPS